MLSQAINNKFTQNKRAYFRLVKVLILPVLQQTIWPIFIFLLFSVQGQSPINSKIVMVYPICLNLKNKKN